jgi:radical SAM superfamily enzyme YgiQ (UPF0313 family)
MNVVMISPYSDIAALGVRGISAVLKQAGHSVRLIFLPYQFPEIEHRLDFMSRYSETVLDQVTELCRGAQLIGVSVMTNYFEQAATLTQHLRDALGTPVIWGGIHPTIRPEECLNYADYVCVGEGEHAMLDVVTRLETNVSISGTPNIHLKENGVITSNPPRPMIENLDSLPFFDYEMDDHHVLDMETDRIIPLNPDLLRRFLTKSAPTKARASLFYQTIASRGCPHHCTYCCWDAYRKIYTSSHAIRRRSVPHIMEELGNILEVMPWFAEITFSDDSFLDAPVTEIESFAREYKKVAGRPFQCLAEPRTIIKERIDPMVDAGMVNIQIGIQSGSDNTKKLYQRTHSNDRVLKMGRLLREYIPRIRPPIYDFILDNPWETLQDKYDTLQLLTKMPPPFFLQIFRLTFFPGTGLFDKAQADGLITDDIRDIYRQQYNEREINYVNLLYSLFSRPVPRSLMRMMCARPALKLFHRPLFNKPLKAAHGLYRKWTVKHAVQPQPPAHGG